MNVLTSLMWGILFYIAGFFLFYIIIYKIFSAFKEMIYEQEMRAGEKRLYYFLYCLVSTLALAGYITYLFTTGGVSIALTGSIGAAIIVILTPTLKDMFKGDYFKTLRLFHGCKSGDIIYLVCQWSMSAFFAEFDYVNFATTTLRDVNTGSETNIINRDLGKYQVTNLSSGARKEVLIKYDDGETEKIPLGYAFNIDFYLNNDINLKEIEDILTENIAKGKKLNSETNELEDTVDEWISGFMEGDPEELKPVVSWHFYPGFVKAKLCFRCIDFYQGMLRARRIVPKRVYHLLRDKKVLINEIKDTAILKDTPKTNPIEFNPTMGVSDV